jgi:energy-converting hydrogenase Eha subunit B
MSAAESGDAILVFIGNRLQADASAKTLSGILAMNAVMVHKSFNRITTSIETTIVNIETPEKSLTIPGD